MLVFGLTGGIGSGKSTVSKYWHEQRGLPIIDADIIARNVVEPKTKCLSELVKTFSETILLPNGTLNRKKLGKIVFGDKQKLKMLDELMFPYLKAAIQEEIKHIESEDYRVACLDSALITDVDKYRPLVIVKAAQQNQIERVMKRNNLTEAEVKQRIEVQTDYTDEANYIINNDTDLKSLYERADEVLDEIFEGLK